jgi:hypothetical protein
MDLPLYYNDLLTRIVYLLDCFVVCQLLKICSLKLGMMNVRF